MMVVFCPQLNSKTGDTFKGFIIRGFKKSLSDPEEEIPAGRFLDTNPEARRMPCHGQTSVTHTNSKDKRSITLQWSPDCIDCQFYFYYTVVQDFYTMWVKEQSELIDIP